LGHIPWRRSFAAAAISTNGGDPLFFEEREGRREDVGLAEERADVGPDVEMAATPPSTPPSGIARGGLRREGAGKRRSRHRRRGRGVVESPLVNQVGDWGASATGAVLRLMQFCGYLADHAA
jgi:hypothetical protein